MNFSIKESIVFAWQKLKINWKLLLGVLLFVVVISFIMETIMSNLLESGYFFASNIVGLVYFVFNVILGIGIINISLMLVDGQEANFRDLFSKIKLFWKYVLSNLLLLVVFFVLNLVLYGPLLYFFINNFDLSALNTAFSSQNIDLVWNTVLEGLSRSKTLIALAFLFVLPNIYLFTRTQFYRYSVVDKELGAYSAIRHSWDITAGSFWKIFVFSIVLVLMNIVGVMLFVVGLVLTVPLSVLAYAYVYRKLSDQKLPTLEETGSATV